MADDFSRFKKTGIVSKDGIETYGRWSAPSFVDLNTLEDRDIISVSITQAYAGRPDRIATDFYGVPDLEWIVVMSNKPLNPLGFPLAGSVIKIPSRDAVLRSL